MKFYREELIEKINFYIKKSGYNYNLLKTAGIFIFKDLRLFHKKIMRHEIDLLEFEYAVFLSRMNEEYEDYTKLIKDILEKLQMLASLHSRRNKNDL